MDTEYIWHCPGESCIINKGTVLFKTTKPFLDEGRIKCPVCHGEFTFLEIMKHNKKNIKIFLDSCG